MRILVIGGTVFVGRHFIDAALAKGHEVTLFHRGQRGADLFPQVERILGDRDGGLDVLGDKTWDAVVDTCGYVPRIVGQSAQALRDRVGRYLFVSTISIYNDPEAALLDENSKLATIEDETVEEITGESYGALKVLCENEVTKAHGDRGTLIRPGLIAGPFDPTNRFTYWVDRFAEGGDVMVTNNPAQPMQNIDARDLGAFMLLTLENNLEGAFNATGPQSTYGEMVGTCQRLNPASKQVPVSEEFLKEQEIEMWQDLPLTMPRNSDGNVTLRTNSQKAWDAGLRNRDLLETVQDTREWSAKNPNPNPRHGITREREQKALEVWKSKMG